MATARTKRLKAAGVAGAVTLLAATGMLISGGSLAAADVNSGSGRAYGALATLGGITILGPTANVTGSATVPATGYPVNAASAIGITVPGVISVGAANAGTQAFGLGTPGGTVISNASVASINVGASAVTADAVTSDCTTNGTGAVGHTQLANATAGGKVLLTTPLVNTVINIPGVATVTLNEEIPFPDPHNPGFEDLVVNGIHVQVLPGILGTGVVDVTLAHSECHVAGPDVNEVVTTSTTPPTTSGGSSTTSGGSSTTSGGGSSTTSGGGGTTIAGGGTTTPDTGFSSVTSIASTTQNASIVSGVLARTGAFLGNALVWAILVLFLGGLALLGSRGEVQTWPPKRSASRTRHKRSGTSWPKNKSGSSKHRFF